MVPFLSSRLDFSPPVGDLGVAGSSLVGGRIDYVDGRAVAALVYRVGDHVVDSFVWPTSKGDERVRQTPDYSYTSPGIDGSYRLPANHYVAPRLGHCPVLEAGTAGLSS